MAIYGDGKHNENMEHIDDESLHYNDYYVDIPQLSSEEWINVETFPTYEEALKYAQEHFGADSNGCVCLITPQKSII